MSTFDGYIKEYPAIAIDNFIPNNRSKYFVLSHVHKDHTRGLEKLEFRQKLYCSEATAKLLPLMETRASKELMYSHLIDYVVGVEYYVPISIETIEYNTIQLTFFPANHCLGASLILIEGENGAVLYTGDMRAEPSFLKSQLTCLKNYRIKNLYMDTTCCYDERRSFISKDKSCKLLADLIKSYSQHRHIYLDTWTVGYEEMWITIRAVFGQKVHVSEQRYNMFCNTAPDFAEVLTMDASTTRFHSCCWDEKCFQHEANTIIIHPTPNRSIQPYEFIPEKQKALLCTDLPYNCKPFQRMILPFSTHSSLEEIIYFYKFIKPNRFTPCVVRGEWDQLSKMMRLLESEGCRVDTTSSSSDIERMNHADSSSASSKPIAITNESDSRSSIIYLSTADTSTAAGTRTLTWPHNSHSTSSSSNHSSHNRFVLPVISEEELEEHHYSLGDKRLHDGIAERRKSSPPAISQHETVHVTAPPNDPTSSNDNNNEPVQEQTNSAINSIAYSIQKTNPSSPLVELPKELHLRRCSLCPLDSKLPRSSETDLPPQSRSSFATFSCNHPPQQRSSSLTRQASTSSHITRNSLSQHTSNIVDSTNVVIFLSMTDSVCSETQEDHFSLPSQTPAYVNDEQQQEKENDHQQLFITAETTQHLIKSIKKVQKKKQIKDKNFGTKMKPICL